MPLEQFQNYRQDLIIGASLQVGVPAGSYDSNKLLNIGTNRWFIKPEVGVSRAAGRVTLELAGAATFYTDNDNYFGGQIREQDPVYSIQGHVIYHFRRGIWGAIDGSRGIDLPGSARLITSVVTCQPHAMRLVYALPVECGGRVLW